MNYTLSDIRKGISDPYLVASELNKLYHHHRGTDPFNETGVGIFEFDWDNLILLDACRYDAYRELCPFSGNLSHRYTLGARTPEFIQANFSNRRLYDLIYISENGWYEKLCDEINADVFKSTLQDDDHFPTRHNRTSDIAIQLSEKYPNKRLLVHFLPPHHPYYGPLAEEHLPEPDEQFNNLFDRIRDGEIDISDELLRQIYCQNLERIFPHVSDLLNSFTGKTVITADHGELLGERASPIPVKTYEHPGIYVDELTKVPYDVYQNGSRKVIQEGTPRSEEKEWHEEYLDQHLQNLGYKL